MLKKLQKIFLLCHLVVSLPVYGQILSRDSLQIVLENCPNDTCKISTLLAIASSYKEDNPEMMLIYHDKANILLSDNPEYENGKKKSLEILSEYYSITDEFEKNLTVYQQLQELNLKAKDTLAMVENLTKQAGLLETLGQYDKAIKKTYAALVWSENINYEEGIADCNNNLGIIFFRNQQYDKSLYRFQKTLQIRQKHNRPKEMAAVYNNIGLVYFAQENLNQARHQFELAISILKKANLKTQLASGYINLGGLLTEQKKYNEAIKYYRDALSVMEEAKDQIGIINAKLSIGEFYLKRKSNISEGISITKEGLSLAKEIKYYAGQKAGYDILKELYSANNNYQKALVMFEQYKALEDSLTTLAYNSSIAELENKYEVANTAKENLILENINNKISSNLKKFVFWGTGIVLLLIGLIIGVGLYFRQREYQYKLLSIELEQKALKAQMNPHFIFNCLVSIQSCIISGDRMTAYNYQAKFAKLLRMILQNSEEKSISLETELKSLQLYIELEQFRTENKFDFKLIIEDEAILKQKTPALLFQPFVENAIWHGLMPKTEGQKLLIVQLTREPQRIKCIIDDNGIGRQKSKEYNKNKNPDHKSMGIGVTKSRIEIFNRENNTNVEVVFHDKYKNGKPEGTTVEFYLPIFD